MSIKFQDNVIENLKTIIIPLYFENGNNGNIVNYTIQNLEFQPQEVILNSVSFYDDSTTPADTYPLLLLNSNLPLNSNNLVCLPGSGTNGITKLDTYFKVSTKNIGGAYTFIITNAVTGGLPSSNMNAFFYNISLTLTFVQYKNLK